eukprot:163668-Chlamydomonas_euryale.AAC.9
MGVESPWSKTAASAVGVAASRWPVGGGGSGTPDSPDRQGAILRAGGEVMRHMCGCWVSLTGSGRPWAGRNSAGGWRSEEA